MNWKKKISFHITQYTIFYAIGAPIVVWLGSNYFLRGFYQKTDMPEIEQINISTWKSQAEKYGGKNIEELNIDLDTELEKNQKLRNEVVSINPFTPSRAINITMSTEDQLKFLENTFPELMERYKQQQGIKE
ncbi:hypothetical protein ABK040_001135 [Willaertia magna]